MVEARRYDVTTLPAMTDPLPSGNPDVTLKYAYDSADQRVLKTAVDSASNELHTVYVFGSLELRRAAFTGSPTADYDLTNVTEVPYLFAHGMRLARVAWDDGNVPTTGSGQVPTIDSAHAHVLFELGDHLGSTSMVLDKATSELVERTTFQAYGSTESDYRPERWKAFREDYKFTGKEEDIEVGLQYFGKRFLAPALNRWISPDPLAVHLPGRADLNLYAYVTGRALKATDPFVSPRRSPS